MRNRIHIIIAKAVKDEFKRFDCRKTYAIWDVYFCSLENLNTRLGSIDKYTLRSTLLFEISEKRRLLSQEDKYKIIALLRRNSEEMQKSNWENMQYISNYDHNEMRPLV